MPTALATDVPNKYDIVINGSGYMLAVQVDASSAYESYRRARARYGYSNTFVDRTNVQGNYGDNQFDFWLTQKQRDWSLGEQQKFYRSTGDEERRYYSGSNLNVRTEGQVTLRARTSSAAFASPVSSAAGLGALNSIVRTASTTNLHQIAADGTITDLGAHGLGTTPAANGLVVDPANITYLTGTGGGTVGVRKWDGASFTTFSATASDALEYVSNTLFGFRFTQATLVSYSTAGASTTVYTWQGSDGTVRSISGGKLRAYGGQLLILISDGTAGPELWLHNGIAPSLIASFPANFWAHDVVVAGGTVFVSGSFLKHSAGSATVYMGRPAIYFYTGGTLDVLWQATDYTTATFTARPTGPHPVMAPFDGGLLFTDDYSAKFLFFDISAGAVHSVGAYTVAGTTPVLAGCQGFVLHTRNQTTAYRYPDTSVTASSGTLNTSLIDFDSSLNKRFKSVRLDADIPTGSTIDVAYVLEDLAASYTTVQTGAVSGTEYAIGQNGRAVGLQFTLNKGTSANGPTLKRWYLRAVPLQDTFRQRDYVLSLTGRYGRGHVELHDGTLHPKSGLQQATDLNTAVTSTTPLTVTDRFGTFTAILEPDGFEIIEANPEEYAARVRVREI